VVTNIRGPAAVFSLGGVPVEGMALLVPTTGRVGLGISICSYAGAVRLGVISDEAVVPDPDRLVAELARELASVVAT
jgi:diacylglycerol O-acyltransferase / wax synthase